VGESAIGRLVNGIASLNVGHLGVVEERHKTEVHVQLLWHQFGLLMHIATMESVSLCTPMKS